MSVFNIADCTYTMDYITAQQTNCQVERHDYQINVHMMSLHQSNDNFNYILKEDT